MKSLNEKSKAQYVTLANEVIAAQRRMQDFLHGVALAMDVDPQTHNFDAATVAFVPKPPPVVVEVAPVPSPKSHANGKHARA